MVLRTQQNERTTKVFAKAGLDNVTSVQAAAAVQAGRSMFSFLPARVSAQKFLSRVSAQITEACNEH
jgi:hypothetical protein